MFLYTFQKIVLQDRPVLVDSGPGSAMNFAFNECAGSISSHGCGKLNSKTSDESVSSGGLYHDQVS